MGAAASVGEKDTFYPLLHSPNVCLSWCWARPKPGSKDSFLAPVWMAGTRVCGTSPAAFPQALVGAGGEVEQPGLELCSVDVPGSGLP